MYKRNDFRRGNYQFNRKRCGYFDCGENAEQNQNKDDARFHQLLNLLFQLCEIADFHIEGRIVLKDKKTGKIWR